MSQRTPVLCIANQKGGVGKTTTAVSLAAGLARRGSRVLLVDLDLQGSATASLCGPLPPGAHSVADSLLGGRALCEVLRPTGVGSLRIAPAGEGLQGLDLQLAGSLARESVLRRVLAPVVDDFDHVVIDTGPHLGLATLNALVASDHVIVPVSCEYLPILGLKMFGEMLAKIRDSLGVPCDVLGYVLTMYDRREKITVEVEAILRRTFGAAVFPTPIRLSTKHKIAPSHRKTIFEFEGPSGRGHKDYGAFCNEVLHRLEARAEAPQTARPTAAESAPEAVTVLNN